MNAPENWNVTRHATPDYAPQFGVYADGESHDFGIIRGEDAERRARLIAHLPELLRDLDRIADDLENPQRFGHVAYVSRASAAARLRSAIREATAAE